MSSPHRENQRTPFDDSHPRDSTDDEEALLITRTRSHEVSLVESGAVPPVPTVEVAADPVHTKWPSSVKYQVLLCAFLTSLSFGVTQVPLLYVFRLMTCDAYYEKHPNKDTTIPQTYLTSIFMYAFGSSTLVPSSTPDVEPDRCSIHAIESSTALSVSLLGASNTVFGLLNLFLTGALIKRIGVKPTLLIQIFFPALRLLVQNVGVEVWGDMGIVIIQCSQIVSIIGGPSGYLLALNTFITEVVDYEGRTAALGRVTGSMMFGSALGFLLGGVTAEVFGIKTPFRLTVALFLCSCICAAIFLPHIPPANKKSNETISKTGKKERGLFSKFFGPLLVFSPRKFVARDGTIRTEYGAFLLAWGVFIGILATGYIQTLLQLYSTDVFAFGTKQNGALIFMYMMLRGVFLTFAFPKLIATGRKWTTERARPTDEPRAPEQAPLLPPGTDKRPSSTEQTFTFDLTYTRFSLLADGCLTLLCTLVRQGWQMYLVAAILPFAAGTGSAAKGTVLQMVGSSATSAERTDALAGVSLVENMARLSTTFAFGVVFAAFASIGRTELVFTCNAATALFGFGVLLFAHFPPEGSRRLDQLEQEQDVASTPES